MFVDVVGQLGLLIGFSYVREDTSNMILYNSFVCGENWNKCSKCLSRKKSGDLAASAAKVLAIEPRDWMSHLTLQHGESLNNFVYTSAELANSYAFRLLIDSFSDRPQTR